MVVVVVVVVTNESRFKQTKNVRQQDIRQNQQKAPHTTTTIADIRVKQSIAVIINQYDTAE